MSIKNNKNNKNICLVYIYGNIRRQKLHYYIVYILFPDIKNIVLFSGILSCNKTKVIMCYIL